LKVETIGKLVITKRIKTFTFISERDQVFVNYLIQMAKIHKYFDIDMVENYGPFTFTLLNEFSSFRGKFPSDPLN